MKSPAHRSNARQRRFLSYPDLKGRGIDFARQHLLRLEKQGKFPRRVQITEGRVAWLETEIDDWIDERAAARYAPTSDAGDDAPAPIAAAPRGR